MESCSPDSAFLRRLLIIGLDGADPAIIDYLIARNRLPNIASLVKEGVYGPLKSTAQPLSPVAWSSFATGTNPGKHGIFDFTIRADGTYRWYFVNASHRKGPAFWDLLSSGMKVGLFNVPFTYPPGVVNGFVIPGLGVPIVDDNASYPRGIISELRKECGKYYMESELKNISPEKFLQFMVNLSEHRARVARYLLQTYDPQLMIMVFEATDRVQHYFWRHSGDKRWANEEIEQGMEAIYSFYETIDGLVGNILQVVNKDVTILILSDHGAGPYKCLFYPNVWLQQEGFLSFAKPGIIQRCYDKVFLSGSEILSGIDPLAGFIKKKIPALAKRVRREIELSSSRERMLNKNGSLFKESTLGLDWSNTKAYSVGTWGTIFINLEGREPAGIIKPGADYENIREEIARRLYELRDPLTGQRVVRRVFKSEEVYTGPMLNKAPDLVLDLEKDYYVKDNRQDNLKAPFGMPDKFWPLNLDHTAGHRRNGIFIAKGPHIQQGELLEGAEIIDVAPSILYLLGYRNPAHMDGRVLSIFDQTLMNPLSPCVGEVDKTGHVAENAASAYGKEEEAKISELFRKLGYL